MEKTHKFKENSGDYPVSICGIVFEDNRYCKKRWDKVDCKNCLRAKNK